MTEATSQPEPALDPFGLAGTVLDKKFRVDRVVAQGGFGVVYRGEHLALEKPVAVKVLKMPAEFNRAARAKFMERFALEARTIARIRHPSIVQVLDFGASKMPCGDAAPWMALEWLTGPTLADELAARRGRGGRGPAEVFALVRPALEAVAYAHDEGIAHRDLKPANMMLVPGKRGSALRLLDFGIAKIMEEGEDVGSGQTRTASALSLFSPAYAAPEQIGRARTGPWTDVHALGLIVSELLTDASPYAHEDGTALLGEVMSPTRPTPGRRGVDVGAWEAVLERALAVKPEERYRDAAALLAALRDGLPDGGERASLAGLEAPRTSAASAARADRWVVPGGSTGAPVTATLPPLQSRRAAPWIAGAVVVAGLAAGSLALATRRADRAEIPARTASAPVSARTPDAVPPSVPAEIPAVPASVPPTAITAPSPPEVNPAEPPVAAGDSPPEVNDASTPLAAPRGARTSGRRGTARDGAARERGGAAHGAVTGPIFPLD